MAEAHPQNDLPSRSRPEDPQASREYPTEQQQTIVKTTAALPKTKAEARKPGFFAALWGRGRSERSPYGEPLFETREETVFVPLFGSGLTREEVLDLNTELAELLEALDIDSDKYFGRYTVVFSTVVIVPGRERIKHAFRFCAF